MQNPRTRSIVLTIAAPFWLLALNLLIALANPFGLIVFLFFVPFLFIFIGIPASIVAMIIGLALYYLVNSLKRLPVSYKIQQLLAALFGFVAYGCLLWIAFEWLELVFLILDDFESTSTTNYEAVWFAAFSMGVFGACAGVNLLEDKFEATPFLKGVGLLSVAWFVMQIIVLQLVTNIG